MRLVDRRYLVLDAEKYRVLLVGSLVLRGSCRRCGRCCAIQRCLHLKSEMVDGRERFFCENYFERPMKCAIYPMPDDPKVEGCGFMFEKVGE